MKTVGIFPASGHLASSTMSHLLTTCHLPPSSLILVSRYPDKTPAAVRSQPGISLRTARYESSPEDLQAAFAGIDVLFLISYPSFLHEMRTAVHLPALTAAHAAGVRHIFYSSLAVATPASAPPADSRSVVMRAHLDTEEHLRELGSMDAGFSWTSIREGFYYETLGMLAAFWDPRSDPVPREVRIPHDGASPGASWAGREDLGEASARLIAQYATAPDRFRFKDAVVDLAGPRVWTMADTVAAMGRAAGLDGDPPLRIREVSVDEYARQSQVLAALGDEDAARQWATTWDAMRAGELEYASSQLEEILGRKPVELEDALREMYKA